MKRKSEKSNNVGKFCTIGFATNLYEIEAYSAGYDQYLVRGFDSVPDGSIYYGWVEASEVNVRHYLGERNGVPKLQIYQDIQKRKKEFNEVLR